MTKEELITIAKIHYSGTSMTLGMVNKLLSDYMIDIDESKYNLIKDFMPNILQHPKFNLIGGMCINKAVKYFENKFKITRLYDEHNSLIDIY